MSAFCESCGVTVEAGATHGCWGPSACPICGLVGGHTIDCTRPYRDTTAQDVADVDSNDSPLRQWWTDSAFDEADQTIAKMEEYGSGDLVALGQTLRRMAGRPALPPVEAMQLGCLIYMLGKIERAVEAVRDDRLIKEDTWFDLGVYAKMARAAQAGAWPIETNKGE